MAFVDIRLHGDAPTGDYVEAEIRRFSRDASLILKVLLVLKRSAMCDAFRVKVEQMEAEASRQLSALREAIEENGFPLRAAASRCYRCGRLLTGAAINSESWF